MTQQERHTRIGTAARAIERRIFAAFAALDEVDTEAAAILAETPKPGREHFAALQPTLVRLLAECVEAEIAGIGFGTVPRGDVYPWLEWWRDDGSGVAHFVAHDLNARNDIFYDYLHRDWFTSSAANHRPAVCGPYVDTGGTNDYTVTLSVPVIAAGEVVGVAGADLTAGSFERLLLRALATRDFEVVLTNSSTRVIASNTPRWLTGSLVRRAEATAEVSLTPDWGAGETPWRLAATS